MTSHVEKKSMWLLEAENNLMAHHPSIINEITLIAFLIIILIIIIRREGGKNKDLKISPSKNFNHIAWKFFLPLHLYYKVVDGMEGKNV